MARSDRLDCHLETLEKRHRALDQEVDKVQRGRIINSDYLSWLKRKRLALRDAIERLHHSYHAKT